MSEHRATPPTPSDAIGRSLDSLLNALELEPLGPDRYRAPSETGRFDRLFGGQLLAQALLAAGRSTLPKRPHSLHAYFLEVGTPEAAVELGVETVRDGRSFSTRRVAARQGDRTLLVLSASFHVDRPGFERTEPAPEVPAPESLPTLQEWIDRMSDADRKRSQGWIERPPPLDFRLAEPPTFLGGSPAEGPRPHWMRVPRALGDDPLLHAALLAYASDYLLLDVAFRALPPEVLRAGVSGFSLDHALWLHRPVRIDEWLLYVQEHASLCGERGLVRGRLYDAQGHLSASVMQEVLVRPIPPADGAR